VNTPDELGREAVSTAVKNASPHPSPARTLRRVHPRGNPAGRVPRSGYSVSNSTVTQEELKSDPKLLVLEKCVRYNAAFFYRKTSSWVRFEDLYQSGWVGAMKALKDHDPGKAGLHTYANSRVRGEILDWLRSLDWVGRGFRKDLNEEGVSGNVVFQFDPETYKSSASDLSAVRHIETLEARIDVSRLIEAARSTCTSSSNLNLDLLHACTLQGKTQTEMAVGCTPGRISQRCRVALKQLQSMVNVVKVDVGKAPVQKGAAA